MKAIVVLIVLTILVVIVVSVYRKWSKEEEEITEMAIRQIEMFVKCDVEELREKADRIIDGSLKVDDDEAFDLSFVLRMKQAKEGEPEHKRDLDRIEQLLQLSIKKTSKNNK